MGVTVAVPVGMLHAEGVEFTVEVMAPEEVTATVCVPEQPLASVIITE